MSVIDADGSPPADWLATPLGQVMLAGEQHVLADALAHVFGLQLVQIGAWGAPGSLISEARTAYASVISPAGGEGVSMRCDPSRLSLSSASVDAVLLPHTLERHASPHAVLREAERVLVGEGRLLVLGFNPIGLWGARHAVSRGSFPGAILRMIRERRLRDWLTLLGFEVDAVVYHCHRLPVPGRVPAPGAGRLEALAPARLPRLLAGGYLLVARKRVYTMTPVRPVLVPKRVMIGGLVNQAVPRDGAAAMDRPVEGD
jgi:SAM-dependent methyltransferase